MNTQDVIDYFRSNSLAHDTHPECVIGELDREVLAKLEKVKTFEERETLVQRLIEDLDEADIAWAPSRLFGTFAELQAFVLQPADGPVDSETNHGDKPGAVSDDTSQVADSKDVSHLSSVVEQRFRKPKDSQELPQTSEPAPWNAGFVDRALLAVEHWFAGQERGDGSPAGYYMTLADEVRRLREQLNHFLAGTQYLAMGAEIDRLGTELETVRTERDESWTRQNMMQAELVAAQAKLARVEALPAKWKATTICRNSWSGQTDAERGKERGLEAAAGDLEEALAD